MSPPTAVDEAFSPTPGVEVVLTNTLPKTMRDKEGVERELLGVMFSGTQPIQVDLNNPEFTFMLGKAV